MHVSAHTDMCGRAGQCQPSGQPTSAIQQTRVWESILQEPLCTHLNLHKCIYWRCLESYTKQNWWEVQSYNSISVEGAKTIINTITMLQVEPCIPVKYHSVWLQMTAPCLFSNEGRRGNWNTIVPCSPILLSFIHSFIRPQMFLEGLLHPTWLATLPS